MILIDETLLPSLGTMTMNGSFECCSVCKFLSGNIISKLKFHHLDFLKVIGAHTCK